MIRMRNTKTIAGNIYPRGSIAIFDPKTETQLIADADADLGLLPTLIGQFYAGWNRSSTNNTGVPDINFVTLTQVLVRGGTMGPNSKLVIISDWDYTASNSTKTLAIDFGGINVSWTGISSLPTHQMGKILTEVQNLNSLSSQKIMNGSSYGISPNPRISASIDTSLDMSITFKCKWSAGVVAETISLLGYSIWHYPGL